MSAQNQVTIKPQPGFQEVALASDADITIIGGAAGGGKTTALIMNPIRHISNGLFRGLFLRKEFTQVAKSGGLWDESEKMYNLIKPRPKSNMYEKFIFDTGAVLEYGYLTRKADRQKYDGSQYAYIAFDQLEHFDEDDFWFMNSRNRSVSGINPYIFCSCNPQTTGWLKRLLSWYLYPDNHYDGTKAGYVIPERDGQKRYFVRKNNLMYWGASRLECFDNIPFEIRKPDDMERIKTLRFIAGTLFENKILQAINPGYAGSLDMLPEDEKNRLLFGCWKAISTDRLLLVQPKWIEAAFANEYTTGPVKYLTADIALEGNDKYVIGYWEGWALKAILSFPKTDGKKVNDILKEVARRLHVQQSNIVFDASGVGGQTGGYLPAAYRFYGNGTPIGKVKRKKQASDENMTKEFINLRSQCYYTIADRFESGEIAINTDETAQNQIMLEFSGIRKMERTDGKLAIEPKLTIKARLGCSPDYADMMMMRAVFELKPAYGGNHSASNF